MSTQDDDLLLTLFTNLRNTASTFGESSKQYDQVRSTVFEHLRSMQATGQTTSLTEAKRLRGLMDDGDGEGIAKLLEGMRISGSGGGGGGESAG